MEVTIQVEIFHVVTPCSVAQDCTAYVFEVK